jgi:PAS domain S-box-containing protein
MNKEQSEITRLSNKEKELHQLSRMFKALTDSSQAMMQAGDERDYLNAVCRIIVENCGYAMAWIGLAEEDEGKTVRPVASAGFETGYLESLDITWADTELGRGPTGTAIRTGKPCGCRNILTDPQFKPWREEAIKRGYSSSIALPLWDRGKVFGAVNIFSREPDAFSDDEAKLLSDLARDLASYGISTIRLRTAHALAEEALRGSEERLKRSQEIAHLGSWELDLEKNVLTWSDEVYRIFGLEPQQDFGATYEAFLDHVHPNDRAAVDAAYSGSVREGRDTYEIEHRIVRKGTGEVRWVHEKCDHQRDKSGKIIRSVCMVLDITERKKAAEALQKTNDELEKRVGDRTAELATSLERFRQTLDNMLEGCIILGFDWSYLYLNEAAARHGHQKKEALLGRILLEIYPGMEQSPILAAYRRCMEERIPQRFESAYSFEDGTTGWFEFRVEPVPEGIFVLSLDITERKQAEAALVQAERALGEAKRLSDVGALAASVAHELRNPLGVIQMAAYNLRRKSHDPALEKHLANIEKKVMESDQIINNLLGYARIKMPLFQEVSIPNLVNECLADMARRFQTDNITIHKDLKEIEGEKIQADPVQIKEIINNILANAYQALEEKKGQIQIRGSRTPKGGVEILIKDNGGGIEKVDLKRVFEPFFTRKSKGTGLGLSLSLELVRLHGGRIEIESEKGKGTAVTIHLPGRRKGP